MKVSTSYNNFARGKIDHDMMGRFDLPIYQSGADLIENFETNFKGNAIYRTGFESMFEFEDCVFVEFKFNNQQQYLCVFYANKIRFLSYDVSGNFGWVLDSGLSILEVATTYSLAECADLDYSQNNDVMVITHPSHAPKSLKRIASNNFTFSDYTFSGGTAGNPFASIAVAISGATQANPVVVTTATHNFRTGDYITPSGVVGVITAKLL